MIQVEKMKHPLGEAKNGTRLPKVDVIREPREVV